MLHKEKTRQPNAVLGDVLPDLSFPTGIRPHDVMCALIWLMTASSKELQEHFELTNDPTPQETQENIFGALDQVLLAEQLLFYHVTIEKSQKKYNCKAEDYRELAVSFIFAFYFFQTCLFLQWTPAQKSTVEQLVQYGIWNFIVKPEQEAEENTMKYYAALVDPEQRIECLRHRFGNKIVPKLRVFLSHCICLQSDTEVKVIRHRQNSVTFRCIEETARCRITEHPKRGMVKKRSSKSFFSTNNYILQSAS